MSLARRVENTAETVAAVSSTTADAADAVDDVVETSRNLVRSLIVGFLVVVTVSVIVKMLKSTTAADQAVYEPPVAVPEAEDSQDG